MKSVRSLLLLFLFVPGALIAQAQRGAVRINEVHSAPCPAPADTTPERRSDWIELYNTDDRAVQLLGMRIAMNGMRHMIDAPLTIAPRSRLLLWCDGNEDKGAAHLRFKLPAAGCTLELIGADGHTVVDAVNVPGLAPGHSLGRRTDGGDHWAVFGEPTPGTANPAKGLLLERAATPVADVPAGMYPAPFSVRAAPTGATIRYTLDGTPPGPQAPEWKGALRIDSTCTLRARCFAADRAPSAELCVPYVIGRGRGTGAAIHISMAPEDLWSDSTGLHVHGRSANHSRTGRAWERAAHVHFTGVGGDTLAAANSMAAGIRISGSGSRGLAKKSFKLYAREAYDSPAEGFCFPDALACQEAMLRADATPHAFLRNLLIETLVRQHGLAVEVQPSSAWPLYLNGSYWGQYRWMPPKDAQWLKGIAGVVEVDVVEGPARRPLAGDSTGLHKALGWLAEQGPVDSIDAVIDTRSLIDLACLDLFTGRADHDLNVRLWRPRHNDTPGRWRWVVFDMDLWAPVDDASLHRIATADTGSAPHLAELLAHPVLRDRLHQRALELATTAFGPEYLQQLADSLYTAHAAGITFDHERWHQEMDTPHPLTVREELLRFVSARTAHFLAQIGKATSGPAGSRPWSVVSPPMKELDNGQPRTNN